MAPHSPDIALNLALAVIKSSAAPLLLLDRELNVIAASTSFGRTFGLNPAEIAGRRLAELGKGEWDTAQLASLLRATASGYAQIEEYEMQLASEGRSPRRLVVNAQKLDYGDDDNVRLVVSIIDVTDARIAAKLKETSLREKDILLQELHHRVANSLQIVASVLMQSARKVQSEETRLHLVDAHQRVMSVAALQHQLAVSRLGDVALRPYFTALCESIGASMIRDNEKISLGVTADGSVTTADISVCLGLIITELVINALKHAFPGDRSGHIMVQYQARGADWTLSVGDDGVGISANPEYAKPGLGTSIVQALASQLSGHVEVESGGSGTKISIVHTYKPVLVGAQSQATQPL